MNNEPASPVCYAEQAEDGYMGFAARDEIVAALTELFEAERAGARATRAKPAGLVDPALQDLLGHVHVDEARWCAMLSDAIKRLGATPSRRCGAFYGKFTEIADPLERLDFLNRGQAWVVRKLNALTPRIRDEALHRALREMADSHVANIERTAIMIARLRMVEAAPARTDLRRPLAEF